MRTQQGVLAFTLRAALAGLALMSCTSTALAAEGLQLSGADHAWPQWQARLAVADRPLGWSATLVGDRYFDLGRRDDGGGLRATGALSVGSHSLALSGPSGPGLTSLARATSLPNNTLRGAENNDAVASPYLGMGYSAWWSRSSLGLSADLGMLGQQRSTNPLGRTERAYTSGDALTDLARTYQWAPVLKVQLSYAF
jgi:hypothetical protein